jgi:hypothetical protein
MSLVQFESRGQIHKSEDNGTDFQLKYYKQLSENGFRELNFQVDHLEKKLKKEKLKSIYMIGVLFVLAAMLMIECGRSQGRPARFVSGYHLVEPPPKRYDLHAWAEVYLQGAGWRGFDPSGMGSIDDRYITLATSSKPELTAAISGSFSGPPGVSSSFSWSIDAEILEPQPLAPPAMLLP